MRRLLFLACALLVIAEALAIRAEPPVSKSHAALLAAIPPSHRHLHTLDVFFPRRQNVMLRGSALRGTCLVPGVAILRRDGDLYLTTPQGFTALSLDEATQLYARPKPLGTYRVVVLGGSTVFGIGAKRPEGTLPAQLRQELSRLMPGRKVEVINAGVPRAASANELLYLETTLLDYTPDLVIAYNGWNDIAATHGLMSPRNGRTSSALGIIEAPLIDSRLADSMSVTGSAGHLAMNIVGSLDLALSRSALYRRLRAFTTRTSWPTPPHTLHPGAAAMYARNLERIIDCSRREKFKLALFLQPLLGADRKPLSPDERVLLGQARGLYDFMLRVPFYKEAERTFEGLARRHRGGDGVCAASLTSAFRHTSDTVYVDRFGHINQQGNLIVATEMARRLQACRLLPATP